MPLAAGSLRTICYSPRAFRNPNTCSPGAQPVLCSTSVIGKYVTIPNPRTFGEPRRFHRSLPPQNPLPMRAGAGIGPSIFSSIELYQGVEALFGISRRWCPNPNLDFFSNLKSSFTRKLLLLFSPLFQRSFLQRSHQPLFCC